ncbi:MAG: 3,4-dihydroxy-2-butanone-4-phosphate synthase [Thermoguttaceae bacterium]|nr:3,4-dihydroxy-2-butanone-4-phosphate synthase [Thermoguttaceae bacterium]MDO4856645.1 3,4-dihydroxy-2-butanone-4-phosphate synthase [Thermoguttaceae bacterium]
MKFSTIEETAEALKRGEIVIMMDDEDRENEGDFIFAAQFATPELVNFCITHGKGIVCVPMLPDDCKRLELDQMVQHNTAPLSTQFTVAVDHISAKTGVTAQERAVAIKALSDPKSKVTDFTRPGHVYPLKAKEGGVLRRAGHTEACIDLMKIAGLRPTAVCCEVLGEDGDRATREELTEIAQKYNLKCSTIEELIRYRRNREKLIYRIADANLPTKYGPGHIYVYGVKYETMEPVVVQIGSPETAKSPEIAQNPLVRMHSSCFTGDLLHSLRCDCGDQLTRSLERMQEDGYGYLIYLPQEGRGIGLAEKIKAYKLQEQGLDTVEANLALGHRADCRDYGVGLQILNDLGITHIRLLTNNPKKVDAFIYSGFDLTVTEQVRILGEITPYNEAYIRTKVEKMGHIWPGFEAEE